MSKYWDIMYINVKKLWLFVFGTIPPGKKLSNMIELYAKMLDIPLDMSVTFFPKILQTSQDIEV